MSDNPGTPKRWDPPTAVTGDTIQFDPTMQASLPTVDGSTSEEELLESIMAEARQEEELPREEQPSPKRRHKASREEKVSAPEEKPTPGRRRKASPPEKAAASGKGQAAEKSSEGTGSTGAKQEKPTVVRAPKRKGVTPWSVTWWISKFVWRVALGLVLGVAVLALGLVGYLTVAEYNPAYAETADRGSVNKTETITGRTFSLLTFNTGYGGLGAEADFYMDGGEGVLPENQEDVEDNVEAMSNLMKVADTDFIFLQEVDKDSARSFETNQWLQYEYELQNYESRFALNYSCNYVPYPLREPMGKIQSGIATYSKYDIVSATRYSLPNLFTWPNRVANMKRCLLVTRIPIDDNEQQLVLINVHMEALEEGEGKTEQIRQLISLVKEEFAKGNFVIAGGDFNQTFPNCDAYPVKNPDLWTPGKLSRVSDGFRYYYDQENPTCRLLNQPYDPDSDDNQFYVIDGFLVSPNIMVDRVETLDYEFIYSDHNPVRMDFTLKFDVE
ncbi:MAG: endonuclease/exonuclease/phosphatase family protein [Oscillospiraceae bacterium]|nr:endonuclease/exonuclease/phosphatase family protein [Oscillospiraceae bacterium]